MFLLNKYNKNRAVRIHRHTILIIYQ
ncbi:hypothetical protein NSPZN2_180021 [Nitrospira defluvii]|uniref:Uncharacterized protein n=1 Tax=Nitrospira defluvii TaxID=330214 RepID=A0ABN7LE53_9BACT|nr:hypothetical protein NSPZN2_180021 [Nitrospira defluvii]